MAASSAARGKVFTKLAREIMVAARSGPDPDMNSKLRLAIERARQQNMPKDNIERAIKKGSGTLEGESYEEVTYEGYGPGGTAILVECLTDNRNRTGPDIRRIFTKAGCSLGEMGSVGWMFKRVGVFQLALGATEEKVLEAVLDAGAEDVAADEHGVSVSCGVTDFGAVRDALESSGFAITRSGLEMVAETRVSLSGEQAQAFLELVAKLEDNDDSQRVFHNCDFSNADLDSFLTSQGM
jgi:YebC/PmpR family DNA-binding regulatory protein